jgi:nucleotide-binding universal stress UspA family protein
MKSLEIMPDFPERLFIFNVKGEPMISKILVPTDGSETAQKAARYAIDLAMQLKCSIIVLSIVDNRSLIAQTIPPQENARHIIEPVEDYLRGAAEAYAREIKKMCDKKGIRSEILVTSGHPSEEITKQAEISNADLIVMGSHGRSALAAALFGSVTYSIIHKETTVPVLVVRR